MLALALLALSAAPQGADWPEYRGPSRTAIVADRDWSPDGAAAPLWQKNVGRGYSCPSIVGDRLVTMGFFEEAGKDRIVCLDSKTGEQHWQYEFDAKDEPRYHGGGTLTTPTVHDGKVYCLNRYGVFHVLELDDGDVVWTRNYEEELKVEKTFHGFSASPLLLDGRMYLQLGGLVVAVDPADGKLLWRSEDLGDISYCNLAPLDVRGTPALATVCGKKFLVFARDDGRVLHEYPWELAGNAVHCAVPIPVGQDQLFLSTAYNKGAALLRLGEARQAERVWSNKRMRNKVTACVLRDGHLYGFDESMLRCIDLDGKSKWRVRGLGLGALSMAGDRLLILDADGELIVAEASPDEFKELSRKKVLDGGVYWTIPVLVDGLIYVRNSLGDMACLDHRGTAPLAADVPSTNLEIPETEWLFEAHQKAVGADAFVVAGKALQLRGTWAIPLRGLPPEPMTLTLVAPDRYLQHLDEGGLDYCYDGETAWAIEPQGPRIVAGDERFELQQLFPLRHLFAPECPEGAELSGPVRFFERQCWKVTATTPAAEGRPADTRSYYFEVGSGRLRGFEGSRRSTMVYQGSQRLGGLTLPEKITRYRSEDGQEHVLAFSEAQWVDVGDVLGFPTPIRLLLRTPEELARDTQALTERFREILGTHKPTNTKTPFGGEPARIYVRDGSLWFGPEDDPMRIEVEAEKDGKFPVAGIPVDLEIVAGADGKKTVRLVTRGFTLEFERVEK